MPSDFIPEGGGDGNDAALESGTFADFVPSREEGEPEQEEAKPAVVLSPKTHKLLASAGLTGEETTGLSDETLLDIDGVGPATLEAIREAYPVE